MGKSLIEFQGSHCKSLLDPEVKNRLFLTSLARSHIFKDEVFNQISNPNDNNIFIRVCCDFKLIDISKLNSMNLRKDNCLFSTLQSDINLIITYYYICKWTSVHKAGLENPSFKKFIEGFRFYFNFFLGFNVWRFKIGYKNTTQSSRSTRRSSPTMDIFIIQQHIDILAMWCCAIE